jgi:hypothetical protein
LPTESVSRHQCLIYGGPPSLHLRAVAAAAARKLKQGYRCFYLNSRPMVAGMRSYLAAQGVDVEWEEASGSLVLTSEQQYLHGGHFDPAGMIASLSETLDRALGDGYAGLWATGDMSWEMGPDKDFS